jgi:hypothetical protein
VLLVLLVLVPHYSHLHWPGRRALRQCHIGVFHRRKAKGRTCPSSEIRGHQFSILGPSRPHKIHQVLASRWLRLQHLRRR